MYDHWRAVMQRLIPRLLDDPAARGPALLAVGHRLDLIDPSGRFPDPHRHALALDHALYHSRVVSGRTPVERAVGLDPDEETLLGAMRQARLVLLRVTHVHAKIGVRAVERFSNRPVFIHDRGQAASARRGDHTCARLLSLPPDDGLPVVFSSGAALRVPAAHVEPLTAALIMRFETGDARGLEQLSATDTESRDAEVIRLIVRSGALASTEFLSP